MTISIEGHHGTDLASAKLIDGDNYKLSIGDKEWLGDGVYFFVKGIKSDTSDLAEKWAIAQAWDNDNKVHKYQQIAVLESVIKVEEENFLDLTIEDGVKILEHLADIFVKKIRSIGKKVEYSEGKLINLARKKGILPIEVVKGNFYIKFEHQRIYRINWRISNCTICAVNNPLNIVSKKIIKEGDIKL